MWKIVAVTTVGVVSALLTGCTQTIVVPPTRPEFLTGRECGNLGGTLENDSMCPLVYERDPVNPNLSVGSRRRCVVKDKDGNRLGSSCIDEASNP